MCAGVVAKKYKLVYCTAQFNYRTAEAARAAR